MAGGIKKQKPVETKEIRELMKIRRWKRVHAERMLELWRIQGISLSEFCRENDIGYTRVVRWKQRLKPKMETQEFIRIDVCPAADIIPPDTMDILLQNGRTVRVRPGFDPDAVHRLLGVVGRM